MIYTECMYVYTERQIRVVLTISLPSVVFPERGIYITNASGMRNTPRVQQ